MPTMIDSKTNNTRKKRMKISGMIGNSRRLTLTYFVLIVWIALAIFAILKDADLYGLAVYFASGLPLILGYLWAESSRPSTKDTSEVIKNILNNRKNKSNTDFVDNQQTQYQAPAQSELITKAVNDRISIYSEDASVELQITQSQLSTLMNIGYVNSAGNKYTFPKNLLEQIKSLISDNEQQPNV